MLYEPIHLEETIIKSRVRSLTVEFLKCCMNRYVKFIRGLDRITDGKKKDDSYGMLAISLILVVPLFIIMEMTALAEEGVF